MNLTGSMGLGARAAAAGAPEGAPVVSSAKRKVANDMTTTELILRFAWWAHQLHRFPSMAQIRDHFNVDRAMAYRWRAALASAHGIEPPAERDTEEGSD